jgi:hypothetical protein
MVQLTTQFITTFKENSLSSSEWKELEKKSRTAQKDHTLTQLEKVQNFLDHVQDLILEGCVDELLSIAERRDFIALRSIMDGKTGITYKDAIFREAVREQIEIEMYVPLRSFTSRHIVNAWRHDDMEMQFKMEVSYRAFLILYKYIFTFFFQQCTHLYVCFVVYSDVFVLLLYRFFALAHSPILRLPKTTKVLLSG